MSLLFVTVGFAAVLVASVLTVRATITRTYPEAVVVGVLFLLTVVQTSSELLSLTGNLRPVPIAVLWVCVLSILLIFLGLRRSKLMLPTFQIERQCQLAYAGVGILSLLTLATGFLVAPNNWDSLTYHLSRSRHWFQNGSLDFFFPSSNRENTMSPLGDLVFAHLSLDGTDSGAAFLGQWVAGLVVLAGVGILAQEIFGNARVTALSVLSAATVPMFLSQMSTTQVDLIAGVPLAASVVAWRYLRQERTRSAIVLASLALGLAVAIKLTSALLVLPWVIIVIARLLQKRQWNRLAGFAATGVSIGLLLNGGHVWRLLTQRSGSLDTATLVFNQAITLEVIVVNAVRNLASLLLVPIPVVVKGLQAMSENIISTVGFEPQLTAATFGSSYTLTTAWSEDHVAAPWHFFLLVASLIWLVVRRQTIPRHRAMLLVLICFTQLLLISAFIRWQPWINRFTFLIIVFAAPLIGWLLTRWSLPFRAVTATALIVLGASWVLLQPLRGLAGTAWIPQEYLMVGGLPTYHSPLTYDRFSQLFMHHPPSANSFRQALSYACALDPSTLRVDLGGDGWELPAWVWVDSANCDVEIVHSTTDVLGRVVRLCAQPCTTADLVSVRTFFTDGPPSPSVNVGPKLVVGVERQSIAR